MISLMTYQHKTTKDKIKLRKTAFGDYVDENKKVVTVSELRKHYKYVKSESKLVRFNNTMVKK